VVKGNQRIALYTTRHCGHCRQAKAFLRQYGIPFHEIDVECNQRAYKEFKRAGGQGVPLILIGRMTLNGFDPKKLKKTLQQCGFEM